MEFSVLREYVLRFSILTILFFLNKPSSKVLYFEASPISRQKTKTKMRFSFCFLFLYISFQSRKPKRVLVRFGFGTKRIAFLSKIQNEPNAFWFCWLIGQIKQETKTRFGFLVLWTAFWFWVFGFCRLTGTAWYVLL